MFLLDVVPKYKRATETTPALIDPTKAIALTAVIALVIFLIILIKRK